MPKSITKLPPQPTLPSPSNNLATAPAGNLGRYIHNWLLVTQNSFIINIVLYGYKIQLTQSNIFLPPVISKPSLKKFPIIKAEIKKLLDLNAISVNIPNPADIVSRVFLVPKSSGDFRMIIDLSQLNNFVHKISFKMENKDTIKSMMCLNDFLVSIDLKQAFHSVSLHPESRRLTTFDFDGQRFAYNVLPFGLSSSPRIFTKILKTVISFLRNKGVRLSFYLDDILICANSLKKVLSDLETTMSLLKDLGFRINLQKSCLSPSQEISHLGYIWNSSNLTIRLPLEKVAKIKSLCQFCFSNPNKCNLRTLASLLGLLVNASNGFKFAPLHFRRFQLCFIEGAKSRPSWDCIWPLTHPATLDLLWWINVDPNSLTPVFFKEFENDLTIYSDASKVGWGASLSSGELTSGSWSDSFSEFHINFLELKAIHLAVTHFLPLIKGKKIFIHSDNSTAVFYLNKMGGTHSELLCSLSLEIWEIFVNNNISCCAFHIAGDDNSGADFLSRFSHHHEYCLSQSAFDVLDSIIPFNLDVDLFASKNNSKLDAYVSIFPDDEAFAINAFSFTWTDNSYIFPPIPLIPKALMKVFRDNVDFCLFITPAWHSLSVIPLLKRNLIYSPIFIDSSYLLGCLPTRHDFQLVAWPISASLVRLKKFQSLSQMLCLEALTLSHFNPIRGSGRTLLNGLIRDNVDPIFLPL